MPISTTVLHVFSHAVVCSVYTSFINHVTSKCSFIYIFIITCLVYFGTGDASLVALNMQCYTCDLEFENNQAFMDHFSTVHTDSVEIVFSEGILIHVRT